MSRWSKELPINKYLFVKYFNENIANGKFETYDGIAYDKITIKDLTDKADNNYDLWEFYCDSQTQRDCGISKHKETHLDYETAVALFPNDKTAESIIDDLSEQLYSLWYIPNDVWWVSYAMYYDYPLNRAQASFLNKWFTKYCGTKGQLYE